MKSVTQDSIHEKRVVVYQRGKIYFNRETERKFYFVLTIIMAVFGVLVQTGILN